MSLDTQDQIQPLTVQRIVREVCRWGFWVTAREPPAPEFELQYERSGDSGQCPLPTHQPGQKLWRTSLQRYKKRFFLSRHIIFPYYILFSRLVDARSLQINYHHCWSMVVSGLGCCCCIGHFHSLNHKWLESFTAIWGLWNHNFLINVSA